MDAPAVPVASHGITPWTTVAVDGRRDDVIRFVDPAADLTAIAVKRDRDNLTLRVSVRGEVVPTRVRYTLFLREGRTNGENAATLRTISLAVPKESRDNTLTATVPLTGGEGAAHCLWVAAETRYQAAANLPLRPVDRIGYRPFELPAVTETSQTKMGTEKAR